MIRAGLIGVLALLAACGGGDDATNTEVEGRVITLALWAGTADTLNILSFHSIRNRFSNYTIF